MTVIAYFVRHGQTTLNKNQCFRGRMNPPLDGTGRQQAERVADFLADKKISVIFYSDKARSKETAETIARKHPEVPIYGTDALWALDVGNFSGQKKTPENQEALDHYIENPSIQIPGGESLNQFKARVAPCIMQAMEAGNQMGAPSVSVVHSSVIHELSTMLCGHHSQCLVEPGGAVEVSTEAGQIIARPIINPSTQKIGSKQDTIS